MGCDRPQSQPAESFSVNNQKSFRALRIETLNNNKGKSLADR